MVRCKKKFYTQHFFSRPHVRAGWRVNPANAGGWCVDAENTVYEGLFLGFSRAWARMYSAKGVRKLSLTEMYSPSDICRRLRAISVIWSVLTIKLRCTCMKFEGIRAITSRIDSRAVSGFWPLMKMRTYSLRPRI